MAESAALLVDEVLPQEPMRQWVLSFPFQLRFLFASRPAIMSQVLGRLVRLTFKLPTVQLKLLRWVAAAGYRFAW